MPRTSGVHASLVSLSAGGEFTVLVQDLVDGVSPFAVADEWIYWVDVNSRSSRFFINRCDLPACANGPTRFATPRGPCFPNRLVADEASAALYWLDDCASEEAGGTLVRCPLSGCEGEPEVVTPGPTTYADFALAPTDLWLSPASGSDRKTGILRQERPR
jgi:hypothetical protein